MWNGALALAMSVALQVESVEYQPECTTCPAPAANSGMEYSARMQHPAGPYGEFGMGHEPHIGFSEELYPYDRQDPWLHGYYQEIPAYGGFNAFRPYNYKHLLAQSQAAGGWGMPATMPYSQQFWHRYQKQAAMQEYSHYRAGKLRSLAPGRLPALRGSDRGGMIIPAGNTTPAKARPVYRPTGLRGAARRNSQLPTITPAAPTPGRRPRW
jgi:hypothetical protein